MWDFSRNLSYTTTRVRKPHGFPDADVTYNNQ